VRRRSALLVSRVLERVARSELPGCSSGNLHFLADRRIPSRPSGTLPRRERPERARSTAASVQSASCGSRLPNGEQVVFRSYGTDGNPMIDSPGIIPVEEAPGNFTRHHWSTMPLHRPNSTLRLPREQISGWRGYATSYRYLVPQVRRAHRSGQRQLARRVRFRARLQQVCAATCCTIARHSLN